MSKKTIIFIASDLRSGSTLLDRLLSNHPQIITVGELSNLDCYLNLSIKGPGTNRDWKCRCGMRLTECPFWSKIIATYNFDSERKLSDLETFVPVQRKRLSVVPLSLLSLFISGKLKRKICHRIFSNPEHIKIGNNCFRVFDGIHNELHKNIFIDSSKRPEQLFALKTAVPDDYQLKVIHLVRDGRAVTYSAIKRNIEVGRRNTFLKILLNWMLTNIMIHNLKSMFKENEFIRIHYEDLCMNTEEVLKTLCHTFEIQFDGAMIQITEDEKHNIGGTPRQFDKNTKIRLDERWKTGMPIRQKSLFIVIAGIFNKYLGY
jgi:hypothetical protein